MHFLDHWFPLVVVIHATHFDDAQMRELRDGYETYFRRNERYAVLTLSPGDSVRLGARERRLIIDWVNDARVREFAKRLCVGAATVVPSTMARCSLTALLWFWTPPIALRAVSNVEEGLSFCAARLAADRIALPRDSETVRGELTRHLLKLGDFSPSLGGA